MPPFAPGDRVHIVNLGRGVVRQARTGGRYVVEIKGRTMIVTANSMQPVEDKKKAAARTEEDQAPSTPPSVASLDLHGKSVAEALEAFDVFLDDAILRGCDEARVIHGRSGGRVKAAVHERLRALSVVRAFRVDPKNPGVTIVRL
jgi:DNA mismatch repair protein MutS2